MTFLLFTTWSQLLGKMFTLLACTHLHYITTIKAIDKNLFQLSEDLLFPNLPPSSLPSPTSFTLINLCLLLPSFSLPLICKFHKITFCLHIVQSPACLGMLQPCERNTEVVWSTICHLKSWKTRYIEKATRERKYVTTCRKLIHIILQGSKQ